MDEYDDSFSADTVDGGSHGAESDAYDSSADTSGSGEDIEVNVDGQTYDAGAATYDFDGDGQADTVEVTDSQGDEFYATDSDHDGTADEVVEVTPDGQYAVATDPSEDGNWEVQETGTVDSDGNIHPDSGSGSTSS